MIRVFVCTLALSLLVTSVAAANEGDDAHLSAPAQRPSGAASGTARNGGPSKEGGALPLIPRLRVVCPKDATRLERLAAAEVVRYSYLRTGQLPTLGEGNDNDRVIVLRRDASALGPQQFTIKTVGRDTTITGGDDAGVLYGAYRYAELLGVRFYLHGDVIPDERLKELPVLNDAGKPLFALRGVNPWGSHPFGFDAWGVDDYKAIVTQLAKMRMNFLGVHCYPEGHPYAEPTVWHGLSSDFDAQGRVKSSYVSRYFNTLLTPAWGGYRPKKTSDYSLGGALLFEDDAWAPEVMREHCPLPVTPDDCNDVFNRTAAQFRDAFTFARELGVKTCIGTETPLALPKALAQRTKDVRAVYEATFRRLAASHPLDYYWLWTPEGWTWSGNKPEQYASTVADVRLAIEALKASDAPFKLATCGWVLGPQHDRAALDRDLPKDIPMSAISRNTGATVIDPAFARVTGREKWAIPWLESDNREGLAGVQLFVGRMRRDAANALAHGCTGLMGLHWRTDILAPNAAALAQAAWNQTGWNPSPGKRPMETVPTVEGPVGGNVASYPGRAIANTTDAPLYQTCRYGMDGYNFKLPNGRYRATLKFCEPHFDAAGKRVGDFKLQGRAVVTDLDIFARVGKFAALDLAFDDIDVTDGWLRLGVEAKTSLPCISAIVIEGAGVTRKIRCGGPAYKDYAADDQPAKLDRNRYLPCEDFYADWARANFGLAEAGKVFAAMDGNVPGVTDGGCPSGSLKPVATPWAQLAPKFAFVDELEAMRPQVKGAGNRDRFECWVSTFKYLRALMKARCAMGAKQPEALTRAWTEAYTCLLATVNTPGGLAMVVNMENHPGWAATVAQHSAQPWPKEYQGTPRLIVPCVRTVVNKGETLRLKIIALPAAKPAVHIRPLGKGDWQTVPVEHLARAVYEVKLPAALEHFEYYITAGENLVWPATAPQINQTVVVW